MREKRGFRAVMRLRRLCASHFGGAKIKVSQNPPVRRQTGLAGFRVVISSVSHPPKFVIFMSFLVKIQEKTAENLIFNTNSLRVWRKKRTFAPAIGSLTPPPATWRDVADRRD